MRRGATPYRISRSWCALCTEREAILRCPVLPPSARDDDGHGLEPVEHEEGMEDDNEDETSGAAASAAGAKQEGTRRSGSGTSVRAKTKPWDMPIRDEGETAALLPNDKPHRRVGPAPTGGGTKGSSNPSFSGR